MIIYKLKTVVSPTPQCLALLEGMGLETIQLGYLFYKYICLTTKIQINYRWVKTILSFLALSYHLPFGSFVEIPLMATHDLCHIYIFDTPTLHCTPDLHNTPTLD